MKRTVLGLAFGLLIAAAVAGCASLATPEAPATGSPGTGSTAAPVVSQQVKDGATLYVQFSCIRCHAADGVGGIPNRLNVGGDDTIPPLNNAYRDSAEQLANPVAITQVLMEGGIVSKKPGVINMPSWKGVMTAAQADAIAAYILAGFPHVGPAVDFNVAKPSDIYTAFACILCHGQVGAKGAPNPASADTVVPTLRNVGDNVSLSELLGFVINGSVTAPGKKGEILMPAWGQILSTQQIKAIMPYIQDGPKAKGLPAPPAATPPVTPASSSAASPAPAVSP
jgi:mono/diheme cytochrome c family protein